MKVIDKIENWVLSLQQAWNSCEFDNDHFVQQALEVLSQMQELVEEVSVFEKGIKNEY